MLRRPSPLRIPNRGNWFSVVVQGKGDHHFRLPRAIVLGEIASALATAQVGPSQEEARAALAAAGVGAPSDEQIRQWITQQVQLQLYAMDTTTSIQMRASEESMGAAIGYMWRHQLLALEADRHNCSDDFAGLLRYGGEVMDELEDADYSPEQVRTLIEAIVPRLLEAIVPQEEEVAGRATQFPR